MYLIVHGSVRVLLKGKEPIEIQAPHWFGEMALLLNQPRSADVMAGDSGATLLRFAKGSVLPVLNRRPEFAQKLRQISDERRLSSGLKEEINLIPSFKERGVQLIKRMAMFLKPW
jgi:CRP-like cAMP-binding protein